MGARKVHPLGVVPKTMVDCGQSTVVLVLIVFVVFRCKITSLLLLQKSCDLGARFVDLEKQQIQLNLDLELAKTELQKAKDGANGKTSLSTDLS